MPKSKDSTENIGVEANNGTSAKSWYFSSQKVG